MPILSRREDSPPTSRQPASSSGPHTNLAPLLTLLSLPVPPRVNMSEHLPPIPPLLNRPRCFGEGEEGRRVRVRGDWQGEFREDTEQGHDVVSNDCQGWLGEV
jgi:hypothetical protein